jgi:hypothetical protein
MSYEDKILIEIVSPRGCMLRIPKQAPFSLTYDKYREDKQLEVIKAFMERERFFTDEQNLRSRV